MAQFLPAAGASHNGRMMPLLIQVATAVVAVFTSQVYHGLLPVLGLKIELAEKLPGVLLVRLEAENKSRVAAKVKVSRLQFVEYDIRRMEPRSELSEWVAFSEDKILGTERPVLWREPRPVMTTTNYIKAGQVVTVEILYRPSADVAVHCGFQVQIKSGIAARFTGHPASFTTTAWWLPSQKPGTTDPSSSLPVV